RNSLPPDEGTKPDPASAAAKNHLQTVPEGKASFKGDFFSSLLKGVQAEMPFRGAALRCSHTSPNSLPHKKNRPPMGAGF
ncbi:hypothetical protein, partial [Leisingera sp. F5]|uniref:hypothetical protein n=1 Tax=Leisingera sp. F5 TaxID=1813816 RepID=UPI0025B911FD